ncbi:MAG TPA: NACHT domain-containing protein [Solirubrobacterales bacterium]|nr:NACHT domain-containing protein [Solirubrobacterales bacterium]
MVEAILLNIVAQAIWEMGLSPLLRGSNRSEDVDDAVKREQGRYATIIQGTAQKMESLRSAELSDETLGDFLSSAEVRNLVTSMFVFRLDDHGLGLEQARAEFLALWDRAQLGTKDIGEASFEALLEAAENVVGAAIQDGVLSAHEARASARHQMTMQHLEAMQRRMDYLVGDTPLLQVDVTKFEDELRREVHGRHGTISPPDFYGAERVPIDLLYVMPHLVRRTQDEPERTPVQRWIDHLQQGVVLGDPGGGKSTLAAKLCHTLSGRAQASSDVRAVTPVMVTLREYSATRKERGWSIVEYIESVASSRYQLDVPGGAIEYLLLSGRLMVIFDGLDELLETRHRQQVRDDVESFHRRFPTARLLVTSRKVGYEQAPLDETVFDVVHLSEFTDEQVESYAHKWFQLEEDLSARERHDKAEAFIEESRAVPDLRTNPLLLALMCNFYLGQNYLPRHLPEVYETCAKMLFETWDRSRGIVAVLPIAEHIRPAMRFLALWIYEHESLQSGASERQLVDRAVEFLLKFRFDDEYEARNAAEAFIDFCAGRAWVFTDTGTTADGEKLFQFTHRTFLEYFAADHLVATAETTAELSERLAPRITKREWWVVAQVAYQLKSKSTLMASDQLLNDIIRRSNEAEVLERGHLLLFGIECLAFLVPSPAVVRVLTRHATMFLISVVARGGGRDLDVGVAMSGIGYGLAKAGAETQRAVAATTIDVILEAIRSPDPAAVAASLCLSELGRGATTPESIALWQETISAAKSETRSERRALSVSSAALASSLAYDGDLNIKELVDAHGLRALFETRDVVLESHAFFSPVLANAAQWVLRGEVGGEVLQAQWIRVLEEAATILLDHVPPWTDASGFFPLTPEPENAYAPVPADLLFGLIVTASVHLEQRLRQEMPETRAQEWVRDEMFGRPHPFFELVEPIFLNRLQIGSEDEAARRLAELTLSPEQRDLIGRWMRGQCDFVASPDGRDVGDDRPG